MEGATKSEFSVPDPYRVDAGVVALVRPPILFSASILFGLVLDFLWPAHLVPRELGPLAGGLTVFALALFGLSVRELRRAATTVRSRRPTTALVKTGPYRFSRNPIYVSFILLQLGIGMWRNSAWILGMLIPALGLLYYGVVAREERYLAATFGRDYAQYRSTVRRWI